MILGIGIDIVDIKRIEKLYAKFGEKLPKKILSNVELDEFSQLKNNKEEVVFLAKKFSLKEAISKSIGCGLNYSGLHTAEISTSHDKLGRPIVVKTQKLVETIKKHHQTENWEIHISSSDDGGIIASNAVLEKI
jgi:holo-[acyl-carrier protein] synthase